MSLATFKATCPKHDLTFTGKDGVATLAAHMRAVHHVRPARPYVMPKAHPWKAPSVIRTANLSAMLGGQTCAKHDAYCGLWASYSTPKGHEHGPIVTEETLGTEAVAA